MDVGASHWLSRIYTRKRARHCLAPTQIQFAGLTWFASVSFFFDVIACRLHQRRGNWLQSLV